MTVERAAIFDVDELDLSDFKPTSDRPARQDKDAIRDIAMERGFVSREGAEPVAASLEGPVLRRRYTTGRNRQLNVRVTAGALARFYALADQNGWVLGETFEHAVGALERALRNDHQDRGAG